MKEVVLDNIDKQILGILQNNARATLKEIAEEVFMSPPAVATRIERLQRKEVIVGYQAKINHLALGYHIKAYINVKVEPGEKKTFYPYIQSCKNVVECDCVTGDYAMLLKVYFRSTGELDQFVGVLQRFGRTKTLIVFSTAVDRDELL